MYHEYSHKALDGKGFRVSTGLAWTKYRLPQLQRTLLTKRVRIQGFIVFDDYGDRQPEFVSAMAPWVRDGKVKFREDVVEGLENAPEAFIGLLEGRNFGKLVVRVAQD